MNFHAITDLLLVRKIWQNATKATLYNGFLSFYCFYKVRLFHTFCLHPLLTTFFFRIFHKKLLTVNNWLGDGVTCDGIVYCFEYSYKAFVEKNTLFPFERQQINFVKSQVYGLVVIVTLSEKLKTLDTHKCDAESMCLKFESSFKFC